MSSVAEISVQPTTDPNIKAYNTRFEMAERPEIGSRGSSEDLGEFGKLFLFIRGVNQVHLFPYVLLIHKAPLFEWDEIEPEVEKILRHFVISMRQLNDAYDNPEPPV